MVCFVWFMSSKIGCFSNIPLSNELFARITLFEFWRLCLFLDLGSVMADTAESGFAAEVREQSRYLDCSQFHREGDNHTHYQNCTIKACLGVCSRDNTWQFCIFLQDEDWPKCANESRKESKSRNRGRAQVDKDTVSVVPDDDDFFDQQSTKKISKEARQDHSGLGKGTTILIAKTVESRLVWLFVLMTTLVNFAYLCRKTIGGPWIGRGVPMRNARSASPEVGREPRWMRIQCLSGPMMIFFDQQSTKKISKEARQDRSGSKKGTTILIAKTVELRHVWVFVLVTTLVSFAYLCRARIGGPWIGRGVPLRDARRASPEVGRGYRWTRMQCLSSLMMMIFSTSSPPRRSARRLVRTVEARGRGQPYSLPKL